MNVGDEPRPMKNVGEPRPYGSSLINCFRQGSAAEPDESPTYQNPFGESENEVDQYSPGEPSSGPPIALGPSKGKLFLWKDPYVNPAVQQQGHQSNMGKTSKTKPKGRSAKKDEATFKMLKKCQGAKVMRQHKNQPMGG